MDFSTVTETPGNRTSREALAMMYARYAYASTFCDKKNVLEVACGAGQGLGYLAKRAKKVVGGDYTEDLLRCAQERYDGRMNLLRLDGQILPFKADCFDVVILCEAIYYLSEPERFFEECRRVLKNKGTILICTVNKEWSDFNPSPFSTRYFSAQELFDLLKRHHFDVRLFGGFPVSNNSLRGQFISIIKRAAVNLHLIPKTMRGKEFLKRIFFGKLASIPEELKEGMAEYAQPLPIPSDSPSAQYKVLYAIGQAR